MKGMNLNMTKMIHSLNIIVSVPADTVGVGKIAAVEVTREVTGVYDTVVLSTG